MPLVLAAVTLTSPLPLQSQPETTWQPVRWSDDRGEPLPAQELFELCRIEGLERECEEIPGDSLPARLTSFDVLQIESEGHGPVSLEPRDLVPIEEGFRLRVPRKARLRVEGLRDDIPVTLSLYPQDTPAAPRPAFRRGPLDGRELRIPAGAYIASLAGQGRAPLLVLLDADPGERLTLRYRPLPGWSLLLRTSHPQSGEPVAGTRVEVEPAAGYTGPSEPNGKPRRMESAPSGLVVFSGIREPIVEASAEHPAFLPVHVSGLSATRGTFAYRDVPLPQGGGADIEVTHDDGPTPGAGCTLWKYLRDTPGDQSPGEEVFRSTTDERGLCRARHLREGTYMLRIRPPSRLVEGTEEASAKLDRVVQILDGQTVREQVILDPTRLEGTVRRGNRPAPGYEIVVLDLENKIKNASSDDALVVARTDEDGHYEAALWTAGDYVVLVQNQSGAPGAMKRLRLDGGTETVDFQLAADEIVGRVVDGEGQPLEKAHVQLTWQGTDYRLATTDSNGDFAFPIEQEGEAELTAHKQGYRSSEPLVLEVGEDLQLAPVVLTLSRQPEIEGRLSTAGGSPVAGGWVSSYKLEVQEPVLVGTVQTGPDGRFRLPVAPGRAHRLFFGGPNCPLGARSIDSAPDPDTPVEILCAEAPANLQITLKTPEGTPREGASLLLVRGKVVYPQPVVAAHLSRLGLPAATDGSGRLALVALEPGEYRLYLADVTSPFNILVGAPRGFLATATLAPWSTKVAELRFELETPGR